MNETKRRYFKNTDIEKGLYRLRDIHGNTIKTINVLKQTEYGITIEDLENLHDLDRICDNADRREENHYGGSLSEHGVDGEGKQLDEGGDVRLMDATSDPNFKLDELLRIERIDFLIGKLKKDRARKVMKLRYLQGKSLKEIAEELGFSSEQSVSASIQYSLKKLMEYVKENEINF